MLHGDWRDIRNVVDKTKEDLKLELTDQEYSQAYKLVDKAIANYREALQDNCVECKEKIPLKREIRCLDCKAPLCERCAPRHFWPNGRPKETKYV